MAATPPSNSKPSGDDRNLVSSGETPALLTFEDRLHAFWKQNSTIVLGLCVFVLLVILGKGVWDRMQASKEHDVESAYASATTPEQLRAFISAHPDHSLAALAELRIADEAYTAGKSADALAGYEKVLGKIKDGPFAARAQLGRALAKVQAGKTADGVADLKQISNDANQFKAIRAEATYQLASLAADAGNAADVQKYSDQLMQIDPASPWTQRGMMLRSSLPAPVATPAAAPAATAPKKDEATSVQVKVPSK